ASGVAARPYYRVPVHRQAAVAVDADLPGTEEAARTHLALPMGPELTDEQVGRVVDACASGLT
ncbi:MAG TPA: DegT/DnrJ/EryC1/StrS family aminotransferase, partial [Thermoleophilaceae bacterium]|nr:DegT/DnrJ/EryC1/StrS family aminotransferase [Thermoleophilaceae bacterium]